MFHKYSIFILLVTIYSVNSQYYDLSNLGAEIDASVKQALEPLNGLGKRITADVKENVGRKMDRDRFSKNREQFHENMREFHKNMSEFKKQIKEQTNAIKLKAEMTKGEHGKTVVQYPNDYDLSNLGAQIDAPVKQALEPLNGLGKRITDDVNENVGRKMDRFSKNMENFHENMREFHKDMSEFQKQIKEQTNAIKIKVEMTKGKHGKTVVQYPNGKTFLVKNEIKYVCAGTIQDGECQGELSDVNYDNLENFCYVSTKARFNNYECLVSGQSIISFSMNGQPTCKSGDNSKTLLITVEEYEKMCGNLAQNPVYTYYADVNDPLSIKIPNENPYLTCENKQTNVCVFRFN